MDNYVDVRVSFSEIAVLGTLGMTGYEHQNG